MNIAARVCLGLLVFGGFLRFVTAVIDNAPHPLNLTQLLSVFKLSYRPRHPATRFPAAAGCAVSLVALLALAALAVIWAVERIV